MGGKYEVRYYTDHMEGIPDEYARRWRDEYTNSFLKFIKLLITKKVLYFKIICIK